MEGIVVLLGIILLGCVPAVIWWSIVFDGNRRAGGEIAWWKPLWLLVLYEAMMSFHLLAWVAQYRPTNFDTLWLKIAVIGPTVMGIVTAVPGFAVARLWPWYWKSAVLEKSKRKGRWGILFLTVVLALGIGLLMVALSF
jgi:hypothetical protein